jgi:hypothetical protein
MSSKTSLDVTSFGNVPDIYAAELTAIEALGPCVRLVFTVPRQSNWEAFREVVANVILPVTALLDIGQIIVRPAREIRKNSLEEVMRERDEESPTTH